MFSANETKDISSELQHNLSLCNVKNVYKNKIIDLIDHIEYSIPLNIISPFEILSAIELLNNKIIYGNLDEDSANKIVQHSQYNIQTFLKLNYDLEYINRDFDVLNYESKKMVLDEVILEYKRNYFGKEKKENDEGFCFGNIKEIDKEQRIVFLKKLINCNLCKNIFKEYKYFNDKYAREILTDKLNILDKNYFLVEEFENLKALLNKDYIVNKKLVDIFINLEKIVLISEEYHFDYKIPFEFNEILDNRIEKETLSKEDLSYLNNPYSQPMLYMIDCKLKYFK